MAVTYDSFIASFPEFSNAAKYPEASFNMWLTFAQMMVSCERWGDMADIGVSLVVAHNLYFAGRAAAVAANGGSPGQATGIVSSKSVNGVSQGMDTASVAEQGAGQWNATDYGQRYFALAMMFGAGGLQLGGGSDVGPDDPQEPYEGGYLDGGG
jgi:Protein of unknown function (DUF4054)